MCTASKAGSRQQIKTKAVYFSHAALQVSRRPACSQSLRLSHGLLSAETGNTKTPHPQFLQGVRRFVARVGKKMLVKK
jgi:hypothetical protein